MMALQNHIHHVLTLALIAMAIWLFLASSHLVKKLVALVMLQAAPMLWMISLGYVKSARAPIIHDALKAPLANPLPHVVILTAIVVSFALTMLMIALMLRLKENYNTLDEQAIIHQQQIAASKRSRAQVKREAQLRRTQRLKKASKLPLRKMTIHRQLRSNQ
jgi:multicomponent Na+:H+ antiporter subunit C